MASDITVEFTENGNSTILEFEHTHFENLGEKGEDFKNMMNGEKGWEYILGCYVKYCEKE